MLVAMSCEFYKKIKFHDDGEDPKIEATQGDVHLTVNIYSFNNFTSRRFKMF